MIISKTPYRISFFGGGTDFPQWFKENDGAVLSTSIDKYCHISLRKLPPFFYHKHRIVYSDIELVKEISEIKHPSARECLKFLRVIEGLEIHHDGDLPSFSGLGSSSSFTVGLLHALKAFHGEMIAKSHLCNLAINVERTQIGDAGGIQDQIAVSHGGLNLIQFAGESYSVRPAILNPKNKKDLEQSLCLFFTGKSRLASEIEKQKVAALKESVSVLKELANFAFEGLRLVSKSSFDAMDFGKLLHENWRLKKSLARDVSNSSLDEIYDLALENGAHGGKLLGAGGGGFYLFCVDSYRRDSFVEAMKPLLHVPFKFENEGSRIVLYEG